MFDHPDSSVTPEGSARPSRRLSRLQRAAIAGGATVGLALGGAGIAFAASSSSPSSSGSTTPPAGAAPGAVLPSRGMGWGIERLGRGLGLGPLAHGQVTVRNRNGGYTTVDIWVGTVQQVSPTSITVKSADAKTQTFTVNSSTLVDSQRDGISSVSKGDTVRVVGKLGGTDTAVSIVDMTKVQSSRGHFGFSFGGLKAHGSPGMGRWAATA